MSEERNWEEEARRDGWKPQKDWVAAGNDPDKWKEAQEFVERGEEILPIVKARLGKQIESLEQRVESLLQTNQKFSEFSEKAIQRERDEKTRLLGELKVARKKAVSEGDGDKFEQADEQIKKLEADDDTVIIGDQQALEQSVVKWFQDNEIFNTNRTAQALLDGFSNEVKLANPGLTGPPLLDKIKARVEQEAPELFENPKRKTGDGVTAPSGTGGGGGGKGRSFDDLPADAKAACAQFEKDIPGFTQETYLQNYDWEA